MSPESARQRVNACLADLSAASLHLQKAAEATSLALHEWADTLEMLDDSPQAQEARRMADRVIAQAWSR